MGAFEVRDCDGDDELDDCNDCNGNENPDRDDIATGFSADCNRNGIPDECDIASGCSQDANDDGRPDECVCSLDIVFLVDTSGSMSSPGDCGSELGPISDMIADISR